MSARQGQTRWSATKEAIWFHDLRRGANVVSGPAALRVCLYYYNMVVINIFLRREGRWLSFSDSSK